MVTIGGEPVRLHDRPLLDVPRPTAVPRLHTVDHRNRDLDENGFLSNHKDNLRWALPVDQSKNKGDVSLADGSGTPVLVTTIADGATVTYKDYHSAAAAAGVCKATILYRCKHSSVVKGKRYEFAPQPDLVKARAKTSVVGGLVKLVLTTQKESWKPAYKEDWLKGGKYFEVRGEKQGPMAERHDRREAKRAKRTAAAGPSSSWRNDSSDDSE